MMLALYWKNAPPPPYFFVWFPLLFAAVWMLSMMISSRVSGWHTLAQRFTATMPFSGRTIPWQSAQFRRFTNYNGALTFGADERGMFLHMVWIFHYQHPDLYIPWSEIQVVREINYFGMFRWVELRLGSLEQVSMKIRKTLADELMAYAPVKPVVGR